MYSDENGDKDVGSADVAKELEDAGKSPVSPRQPQQQSHAEWIDSDQELKSAQRMNACLHGFPLGCPLHSLSPSHDRTPASINTADLI